MKKLIYIIMVLLVAMAISFSVAQFFRPFLEAASQSNNIDSLISVADFLWQFLLLGFVIGGVIFTIPRNKSNEDYLSLAGMFCILGSSIMVAIIGFGVAAKTADKESVIILLITQIGLTLFYSGIAITTIELAKECWRISSKFYKQ